MITELICAFVEAAIAKAAMPLLPRGSRISRCTLDIDGSVIVHYCPLELPRWRSR